MSFWHPTLSPQARAFLEHERAIPPQPAGARARMLARARGALAARVGSNPFPERAASRTRWAVAVVLMCITSAAMGAVAYELRARLVPLPLGRAAPSSTPATSAPALPPAPPVDKAAPAAEGPPIAVRASSIPRLSKADAARAELRLLRLARGAVAREDFATALPPLAEHAQRFKNGRLA